MRNITEIIIHCSATPAGREVHASDIDRYHRLRGFSGIGYHYLVTAAGDVEKGRPDDQVGAHCLHHNKNSIGVCYVGGLDAETMLPADTRTPAQRKALINLLGRLRARYPRAVIHAHRDFADKACPCFDATTEYRCL